MSLRALEESRRIKKSNLRPDYITNQLAIADHNLLSAKRNLEEDPDLAFGRSYVAMLAAGRALMGRMGYIPDGNEQHYSVELFLEQFIERKYITQFGIMRRKRHILEYEQIGIISPTDATDALAMAESFVQLIKSKIAQIDSGSN